MIILRKIIDLGCCVKKKKVMNLLNLIGHIALDRVNGENGCVSVPH